MSEMWKYVCPQLLNAIELEPEKDVLPDQLGSLANCIETLSEFLSSR